MKISLGIIVLIAALGIMRSIIEAREKLIDRREPTVTQEEADVINKSLSLSRKDLQQAVNFLKPNITSDSSAAMDFAIGNFYFQQKKMEHAISTYQAALKKMPGFDRARTNLARIYLQQDKTEKAYKELKVILDTGEEKASVLTLLGYIYLLNEQAIPAESAYRKALLSEPNDSNAYLGLAKALLLQQRYSEAQRIFIELLDRDHKKNDIWMHLANTQMLLGETAKAIITLESARRLQVLESRGLATLGDLYLNQGQAQAALDRYQEAFKGEYGSPVRLLRAIEGFLLINELKSANSLIEQARVLEKKNRLALDQKKEMLWLTARHAHLAGQKRAALKKYKTILSADPLNGQVLIAMGDLYRSFHNNEQAGLMYERAARIDNVKVDALTRHAQLEVKRARYAQAVELLEHVQLLQPSQRIDRYLKQVRQLTR